MITPSQQAVWAGLGTLRELCSERGGDGDKAVLRRPVVYRHLFALTPVISVPVTLVHKLIKTEAPIH